MERSMARLAQHLIRPFRRRISRSMAGGAPAGHHCPALECMGQPAMRGRSRRSPTREEEFLASLAGGWSVKKAAEALGVARRTVYCWKAADAAFSQRWDDALEQGTDILEDEATRRAVEGVQRPEFYQGDV